MPLKIRSSAAAVRSAENERSEQGQSSATTPGEGRTTAPRLRSSAQHSCHLTMAEIPLSKRGKWADGVESGREYLCVRIFGSFPDYLYVFRKWGFILHFMFEIYAGLENKTS